MIERLDRGWRVVATGLCFAAFGVGGLLLRLLAFPALQLFVREPRRRARLARDVIRHGFRLFIALMRALGVLSYDAQGLQRLQRRGLLILANHPSLVDVVFLMAFVEQADCIVKAALSRNPFTRGPVRAANFICNDSGASMVEDCLRSLREGGNLIIFPEGTRTPRDGTLRLQRGAANVAVRGRIDVTPVHIHVDPPTLVKGEAWWRVPPQRPHFTFRVGFDIAVAQHLAGAGEALAARRLNEHLTQHFALENDAHAAA